VIINTSILEPYNFGGARASVWIRIRKNSKLFAGYGSGIKGYWYGSETGIEPYQKSSITKQFVIYDIKITGTLIWNFFWKVPVPYVFKYHENLQNRWHRERVNI
jgi:hypothetical protein